MRESGGGGVEEKGSGLPKVLRVSGSRFVRELGLAAVGSLVQRVFACME